MRFFLTTFLVVLMCGFGFSAYAKPGREVIIINDSSYDIVRFHAVSAGATTWEEDILGDDVMMPGDWLTVDFDDGTGNCVFTFKVTFWSGRSVISRNVNVCKIETFRYHD